MKIGIFTSNQPRHLALIDGMAKLASQVFVVMEASTLFPGEVQDFWNSSSVFAEYFQMVRAAEREIFGDAHFLPENARSFIMHSGDVNRLSMDHLKDMLACDIIVVFGASYIKGPLAHALAEAKAVNIHMGISPFYRGNSTNFWPLFDGCPEFVGATIHRLTTGLDSGPILFHALPQPKAYEKFQLGMASVAAAHTALCNSIRSGELFSLQPVEQDRSKERRYTRKVDFTEFVARRFLDMEIRPDFIEERLKSADRSILVRPQITQGTAPP